MFYSLGVEVLVALRDARMTCSVVMHSVLPDIVVRVQKQGVVFS